MSELTEKLKAVIEFDVKPAHREICDLAASGGGERWRMSIPVRTDDSDMVLQAPLDHLARLQPVLLAMVECVELLAKYDKTETGGYVFWRQDKDNALARLRQAVSGEGE